MSKIKLLVEIDEKAFKRICFLNKTGGYTTQTIEGTAYISIANGTPYNPSGDCISREQVLKELMAHQYSQDFCKEHGIEYSINSSMVRIIVNGAPPVDNEQTYKDAYEQGYADGWKERYGEPDGRPKGEWLVRPHFDTDGSCDGYELYCSECEDVKTMLVNRCFTIDEATERLRKDHTNFCSECGADMRTKENESV